MISSDAEQNGRGDAGFHRTPRPRTQYEERLIRDAEERQAIVEAHDRARFWFAVRTALACIAGCIIGFVPMAWALHTTDIEKARTAFAPGPALGACLVLIVLVHAAMRWERDDW
jgi:hypothetical protein